MSDRFIINTFLFALDYLSLISKHNYSDRIKTRFCSLTVGVLPQRTNLPYKTTSAFRTAPRLMAGSQENGHANSFQHPCSYPGPKGSEIICSSQFSTSEEKILPDRPLIVSHLAGE